jgi:hypothetical protein
MSRPAIEILSGAPAKIELRSGLGICTRNQALVLFKGGARAVSMHTRRRTATKWCGVWLWDHSFTRRLASLSCTRMCQYDYRHRDVYVNVGTMLMLGTDPEGWVMPRATPKKISVALINRPKQT